MVDPFTRLQQLADEGDLEGVEAAVREALPGTDEEERSALYRWLAWAAFEQGDYGRAIQAAQEAGDALIEAAGCFHLWEFADAEALLEEFESDDEEDLAEAAWYRGLLEEFAEEDPLPYFKRAVELAPHAYSLPVRLSDSDIDAAVMSALGALPEELRPDMESTAVEVHDLPRPHPDVDPLSLGLYLGANRLEQSLDDSGTMPPRIEIYRKNIERFADDPESAADELRITLLHEVGHHFGLDEDDLARLGYE